MGAPGSAGLGSANPSDPTHPASANPIRYAEIVVTNGSGSTVQCGETAADGSFSLSLPQISGAYKISINSRALNSHLHASVLNSPDSNTFYSLTTTVSGASSSSVGTLTAPANGTILGGAFNILDQLLNANIYLVAQVGSCASTFSGCLNYDPTVHKIAAYWKPGFNPNTYFGDSGDGLSFYLPGYSRLFILGGIDGDTNSSDTDHFDNSIIIHEYGHFLEDNWLKSDSPGGMHDGNEILDPRLAWSEGWGDFIQAAVRGDGHYIDTMGNTDGSTEMLFYVDTESVSNGGFDYTTNLGEGNFREFSITRLLWDAIDPGDNSTGGDSDTFTDGTYTDNVNTAFNEIWASLSKSSRGYRDALFAFRNVGLLHLAQEWLHTNQGAQDWTQIRGLNRHLGDTTRYGQTVVPVSSGACSSSATTTTVASTAYYFNVTPTSSPGDDGSLTNSNLFLNNRFYDLKIGSTPFASAGSHTLTLEYRDDDQSGTIADLDLYLYNKNARFGTSDILSDSRQTPSGTVTDPQTESVSYSLSNGDYLINVSVFTGGTLGGKADFNLKLDGVVLCPYDIVQ